METRIVQKLPAEFHGDMRIQFLWQQGEGTEKKVCGGREIDDPQFAMALSAEDFRADEGESFLSYREGKKVQRLLYMGLGSDCADADCFRRAGGAVAKIATKLRCRDLFLVLPALETVSPAIMAQALVEGVILGQYRFDKYKTVATDEPEPGRITRLSFYAPERKGLKKALAMGSMGAMAACRARDMANEPGNHWTPQHFADYAAALDGTNGLKVRVFGTEECRELGMGGLLGVNQGSGLDAKLIAMEYLPYPGKPTLLLVGKGLTFDSGGISLKPGAGMEEMKYDMCGGAAVVTVMEAVSTHKLSKINVVGLIPATENMPGPHALKPGDIVSLYGGKTVEVANTDAEGRLILADAIAYGVQNYAPDWVIDIATLTGAVIVGLGHHRTGLLGNDDSLVARLQSAGEFAGEPLWRLPLDKQYRKQLKSEVADIRNVSKQRDGGTITGGAFLEEFVGETPWAHLDIAGTAWNFTEKPYCTNGPSGTAVRTLIALISRW